MEAALIAIDRVVGHCPDDLDGLVVGPRKAGPVLRLQAVATGIHDGLGEGNDLVVLRRPRVHLGVEIHRREDPFGRPAVHAPVHRWALGGREVRQCRGQLLHDEVIDLLAGALLGEALRREIGDDGDVPERVEQQVVVVRSERLQLGEQPGLQAVRHRNGPRGDLIDDPVDVIDATERVAPQARRLPLRGVPLVLVQLDVGATVVPAVGPDGREERIRSLLLEVEVPVPTHPRRPQRRVRRSDQRTDRGTYVVLRHLAGRDFGKVGARGEGERQQGEQGPRGAGGCVSHGSGLLSFT